MKTQKIIYTIMAVALFFATSCSKDALIDQNPEAVQTTNTENFSVNKNIVFPDQFEDARLLGKWNLTFVKDIPLKNFPGAFINIKNYDRGVGYSGELYHGCRNFGTTFEINRSSNNGGSIHFNSFLGIREFCGKQDVLLEILHEIDQYEIKGNKLALFNKKTSKGVVFTKE